MSNGYKAPSGLGSAVRSRSMVRRNYTAGIERKAADREATLGLVQGILGGAADLASSIESNVESWEEAEKGARTIFEDSPQAKAGMTFEEFGYTGPKDLWTKYTKSAGEVSETQVLGDSKFSVAQLIETGGMDSVVAKKQGDAIYDDNFQIIGRKSLYESFGESIDKKVASDSIVPKITQPKGDERAFRYRESDVDSSQVIKNNNQQQQKQNATGGLPPDPQTNPLKGESFVQYNKRLRSMDLNPKDFNYSELSESLYGETKEGDSGIDFSSIESVEVPSLPKAENKDNNRGFAFTYKGEPVDSYFTWKGEKVDLSELIGDLFKKDPEEKTEEMRIAERLKRMGEGSLSTSPSNR